MKKIIAFGASNSQNSINKKLAIFAASQFQNVEIDVLDLNDFEMPIYSIDREKTTGLPKQAHTFYNKLGNADLLIISFRVSICLFLISNNCFLLFAFFN